MVFHSPLSDVDIPETSVHDEIFAACAKYGDRPALICGESGRRYTYQQVAFLSRCVASGLAKHGVKKGKVVAILLPNMPEYAFCFFGILAAGGIVTTINPAYTPAELSKQVCDSEAYAIITVKGMEAVLSEALKKKTNEVQVKILMGGNTPGYIPFAELMSDDGSAYPSLQFDVKNDVADIPYSSGTTGLPKGVMLTHHNVVSIVRMLGHPTFDEPNVYKCHLSKYETTLCILPLFHAYALHYILTCGLWAGNCIVVLPAFKPETFLKAIQNYKINLLNLVPPLVVFLAKSPLVLQYDLSSVKRVMSGAAPLSADIISEFRARVPVKHIVQAYGLTETTLVISFPNSNPVYGSSGIIIPNTQCRVVDPSSGQDMNFGEKGEIWTKGPHVMKGYFRNPKASAEMIDNDGWLHTGDIGYVDTNYYVFIVDRIKELIKYKGFQVAPAEMEALLLTHPDIADAAVIGVPDPDAGELPRAYVVIKEGHCLTETQVHAFIKDNAAPYKQLRGGLVFVMSIPKTPSGKIKRNELFQDYIKNITSKL